ncbi:GPI mannosyltransferase 4 isoform X1 [Maniola jurtina]|uniref:GPI mannosyltransferase 4 isoform X1 n=2 Tax=Maniola jurtina TaxID=191418 RepID=UPI001E68A8EF|nr:GPI mannosyltransferase 4 isoform X1 [Maniola jurtina]
MFLKSDLFKAIAFKNPVKLPLSYWLLVGIRFVLTLLPQSGYIHPDEFFQNVEVIAGDIFTIDVARTWEFNPKFPIRNILVPKLILGPPLHLIHIANPYTKYYLNIDLRSPYFLLTIPRLFICFLSLINDYCLYRICVLYGQNFRNRLKVFASSYVVLVYCCRSFSNAFEMMFFSILLLLVAECMYKSDKVIYHNEFLNEKYDQATTAVEKVKIFKLKTHLPHHSLNHVAILATVVVIGIFNRPTFVGFAFPPIFFWLHRGLGSKVIGFKDFHYRIFMLILSGIPIFLLLIVIDSSYYGYLTMADIESLKLSWDNWVVTPVNFLRYNSDLKNLDAHGLHPRWLHLAVNIPLLFNVLGVMAFLILVIQTNRFIRGQYSKLPRIQSITGLMLFSLVIPVAILSLFPHQEARFIIPILTPLVYLYGNYFYPNDSDGPNFKQLKKTLLYVWYALNMILTIFFGFIHQGGLYPFAKSLHHEIKSMYGNHFHVITTHSYSIPTYLLQLESTTRVYKDKKTGHNYRLAPTTFIHKYGSMSMKELFMRVDDVLTNAEMLLHKRKRQYRFYIASPCSLEGKIRQEAIRYNYIQLNEEFTYYPHFCSEAFPEFPNVHDQFCLEHSFLNTNQSQAVDLTMLQRISCFFKRFCLRIYRVSPSIKS